MAKGVGIGPEQMAIVKRVFEVANAPIEFEVLEMSGEDESDTDMNNLIYSVERNGVGITGRSNSHQPTARPLLFMILIRKF